MLADLGISHSCLSGKLRTCTFGHNVSSKDLETTVCLCSLLKVLTGHTLDSQRSRISSGRL